MRELHVKTPLIKSDYFSSFLEHNVYLKMESSQVSGSFKIRGIGNLSAKCVENGCKSLIGCSGGNAGIAVAHAAKLLNVSATVFVPETTSQRSIALMKSQGSQVIVKGANYNKALEEAIQESKKPGNALIDAYDHPDIWEGHSTIISEIQEQLNEKPSIVIVPVGGGGLLLGILQGLENAGWTDVPVLAMETLGAHCFNMSVKAGKVIPLENITSIAKTLGARTVPQQLIDSLAKFKIISEVVTDAQAVSSCLHFAANENTVVEPSCGAALASVYCKVLQTLIKDERVHLTDGPAIVIVSGGSGVTLNMLQTWANEMNV
ncbi:hypothetical protein R5R35_005857 [Gryllus longicercus]|uniref:L-serine ammonia-lyase n=1 Tax=Gryllus longicercus TaxID=2509291 RepID=A0AAN9V461_9ORTH